MKDIFGEHVDPARDIPAIRSIPLDNGNKYNIKFEEHANLYSIHMEKGQIPDQLKGMYTTYRHAKDAVEQYLRSK